jgi:hypothetical protein
MKNSIYFIVLCFLMGSILPIYAQKENVGIGTTNPDQSAALEISSTSKGLLMPRMPLQKRLEIQNPAKGLIVYQTDMLTGFYYFDGVQWKSLNENISEKSVSGIDGDWTLLGNSGLNASINFIGTTDNTDLVFKANSVKSGTLDVNGTTLFGYASGFNYNTVSSTYDENSAFGAYTLFNNSRGAGDLGSKNTAMGYDAMRSNTTGYYNVALGRYALRANTFGHHNVALGGDVLASNTEGNFNMGIGWGSLFFNTIGNNNLAIGANALNAATGNNNTALGSNAGMSATGSSNVFIGYQAGINETASEKLYISNSLTNTPLVYGDFATKYLAVGEVAAADRAAATSGGYRLLVKGGMITEKIKVAVAGSADWADYVFEPSYKLMSLDKVESFVKENKHLPNVPSAEEMSKNGLDVMQTSAKLMEKIEELTLYMIEMNKEIQALKTENAKLKK